MAIELDPEVMLVGPLGEAAECDEEMLHVNPPGECLLGIGVYLAWRVRSLLSI